MTGAPRVLVVVPTYDEVDDLGPVLARLHVAVPAAHALVVDDGSPDGTGELAEAPAAPLLPGRPGLAGGAGRRPGDRAADHLQRTHSRQEQDDRVDR